MATHRLRRNARRALMVALAAMIGVGIAGLAATSEEPSKPGPVLPREGNVVAAPDVSTAQMVATEAPLPTGVTCPDGWSYFDNPVMNYGLCVPPGWGFSDFRGPEPLNQIPVVQLENLHLLGNAFPWHPGALPFDAVRNGAFDVELDVLPAAPQAGDECQPVTKRLLGLLSVFSCEQRYGEDGLPAATGLLRALKVIVPLKTGPADEPGARLLVIARSRIGATPTEVKTLWQIVQYIRAY